MNKLSEISENKDLVDDCEYYAVILMAIENGRKDVARRLLDALELSDNKINPRIMSDLYQQIGEDKIANDYEVERQKIYQQMIKVGMYSHLQKLSPGYDVSKDLREGSWASHF